MRHLLFIAFRIVVGCMAVFFLIQSIDIGYAIITGKEHATQTVASVTLGGTIFFLMAAMISAWFVYYIGWMQADYNRQKRQNDRVRLHKSNYLYESKKRMYVGALKED